MVPKGSLLVTPSCARLMLAQTGVGWLAQRRRSTLGKSSQTFTPQKCEPSVQIGVVIPART